MNRKHKINLWLVFFVVALFVVSTGVSAMGNIVKNDVEKNNVVITMDTVTKDVGSITVDTIDHTTCNDPIVVCNAISDCSIDDVLYYGTYVQAKVDCTLRCPGADDEVTIVVTFGGEAEGSGSFKYGLGGPNELPLDKEFFVTSSNKVYPGEIFTVEISADYWDGVSGLNPLNPPHRLKYDSDSVEISICELDPDLGIGSVTAGKAKAGQQATASFRIYNSGDLESKLDWHISDSDCSIDLDSISEKEGTGITSKTGNGYGKLITVKYTLPNFPKKDKTYEAPLRVYADNDIDGDDGGYKTVTLTFKTKDNEAHNLALHNIIQARFPQLFTLLQRLPAFQ